MPDFLFARFLEKPLWMWGIFLGVVLLLLAFDLGVMNRKARALTIRQSLRMSAFYIAIGLAFSLFIYWALGGAAANNYLTGYIVEETLSMDNIFVMSLVFGFFAIPRAQQYRVLFWGILGVVVLRGIMIAAGSALVHHFGWVLYIFGVFLIFTGIKMLAEGEKKPDIENNPVLNILRRIILLTPVLHGQRFFVRLPDAAGKLKRFATPLFAALVVVECVDLVFALDSVPAIFAITDDTYVVYTSNIFAILGLRALYFALSAMIHRFEYLKYSLALVLVFIGSKIFIVDLFGLDKFPGLLSLTITLGLLAAGVLFSLFKTRKAAQ